MAKKEMEDKKLIVKVEGIDTNPGCFFLFASVFIIVVLSILVGVLNPQNTNEKWNTWTATAEAKCSSKDGAYVQIRGWASFQCAK